MLDQLNPSAAGIEFLNTAYNNQQNQQNENKNNK